MWLRLRLQLFLCGFLEVGRPFVTVSHGGKGSDLHTLHHPVTAEGCLPGSGIALSKAQPCGWGQCSVRATTGSCQWLELAGGISAEVVGEIAPKRRSGRDTIDPMAAKACTVPTDLLLTVSLPHFKATFMGFRLVLCCREWG